MDGFNSRGVDGSARTGREGRSRDSIARSLFALALPIIGLNLLTVLTLAVDTAMCGRLEEGEQALTALGFATQIVFLLMVVMMGLTVGTVALVARAFGARDADRVHQVVAQSTTVTMIVGLAMALLGNLFAAPLLRALDAPPEALDLALAYLRPLLAGSVFSYLVILYGAILRAVGNTRLPFLAALLANAINIFLDYALIGGNLGFPALGVRGAAVGTIVAWIANIATIFALLARGFIPQVRPVVRPHRIDPAMALRFFRIGAPAALDMVIINVGFLSIVGMLGRIDDLAVAAHGIGIRIQSLAFVPGLGVAQATGALVGNSLGARDAAKARRVVRASLVLCTALMSAIALAIVLAVYPIVGIFQVAAGSELEAFSVQWIRLLGYCMPFAGMHLAFVGMLQGSGATNTSLQINFFATILFQVPASALLGFAVGLEAAGVWLAFPISFVVRGGLGAMAYRYGRWAKLGLEA